MENLKTMESEELYRLMGAEAYREAAFREIYARHSARIYAYCKRILSDSALAEDVFQDTFLVFLKEDGTREITNLPAFLLRISRNIALNKRREYKKKFVDIDDLDVGFDDKVNEHKEVSELIARALDLLPDDQREAVVLQNYEGMSYEEISELKEVPVTTVRNWLVRGKKKLKTILQPYFEPEQLRRQNNGNK